MWLYAQSMATSAPPALIGSPLQTVSVSTALSTFPDAGSRSPGLHLMVEDDPHSPVPPAALGAAGGVFCATLSAGPKESHQAPAGRSLCPATIGSYTISIDLRPTYRF